MGSDYIQLQQLSFMFSCLIYLYNVIVQLFYDNLNLTIERMRCTRIIENSDVVYRIFVTCPALNKCNTQLLPGCIDVFLFFFFIYSRDITVLLIANLTSGRLQIVLALRLRFKLFWPLLTTLNFIKSHRNASVIKFSSEFHLISNRIIVQCYYTYVVIF